MSIFIFDIYVRFQDKPTKKHLVGDRTSFSGSTVRRQQRRPVGQRYTHHRRAHLRLTPLITGCVAPLRTAARAPIGDETLENKFKGRREEGGTMSTEDRTD